jgi:hypothetical protein
VDIADVKKELSSDEKLLESAFKLETLYKKYKFIIWGVGVALLLFFAGTKITDAMKQSTLEEANGAFLTLQTKADDATALATLKEKNPALYELFVFSQAAKNADVKTLQTLQNSSNEVVADASKYSVAAIEKKPVDSKLYHEMALLEEAYLAIKAGDIKSANAKLELIDEQSSLSTSAQLLKHATLLKAK